MGKKLKRNIIILIITLLILAGIGLYLNSLTETFEFEEFSVEAPFGSSFYEIPHDKTVKEQYRCANEDMTVTSFDKKYIEETYYSTTGEHFDYTAGMLNNLSEDDVNMTNITDNITRIVLTSNIDGYIDTDVACIYHDDAHVIIIEGGDVDFITKTAKSVKII